MENITEKAITKLLDDYIKQNNDKLLTDKQVGEMLSFSRDKVWKLNKANKIPSPIKVNGSTRWKQSAIQQHIRDLS